MEREVEGVRGTNIKKRRGIAWAIPLANLFGLNCVVLRA